MRTSFLLALAAVMLLAACTPEPDHSSMEAFLRNFIQVMDKNERTQFPAFYLQEGDFKSVEDTEEQRAIDELRIRALGTGKSRYLRTVQTIANRWEGKKVEINSISENTGDRIIASVIKNVEEHYADVRIELTVGEEQWSILISEVIKTDGKWRLTAVRSITDLGTETLDDVHLEAPAPEETRVEEEPAGQ